MHFHQLAWHKIEPVFQAIVNQPFNQQLSSGVLEPQLFAYYIEQDSLFLQAFAKCLTIIAAKAQQKSHSIDFLDFAKLAYLTEQELLLGQLSQKFPLNTSGKVTQACLGYTSFLLTQAYNENLEMSVAATVPCFWIYNQLGKHLEQTSAANNPYALWIDNYCGSEFESNVRAILSIADQLYQDASFDIQRKMLSNCLMSSLWEYYFWQDIYNLNSFDFTTH